MDLSKQLVEQCRQGDRKAQYELYAMYARAMFNVSCRIIPDRMEAEDAMQEAFFKAFRKIDSFRNEVTFGAWLKRIVVNTCLDHLKQKKLQLISIDEAPQVTGVIDNPEEFEPESVEQVKQAIEKLPDGYRLVITLRLIEELEYEEIAEMLGVEQSTVRSQYTRARQKLLETIKTKQVSRYGNI